MSDTVIETFHYEIEERAGEWWTRFLNPDGSPRDNWIGPYPTREKADAEVRKALEQVLADFTKIALGLN